VEQEQFAQNPPKRLSDNFLNPSPLDGRGVYPPEAAPKAPRGKGWGKKDGGFSSLSLVSLPLIVSSMFRSRPTTEAGRKGRESYLSDGLLPMLLVPRRETFDGEG